MENTTIDQSDLARLNEKDKLELQTFITHETQKTRINAQTHTMAEMCWKKCITGSIKSSTLSSSEEGCLANCVDRFLDINTLTVKNLQAMRASR